MVLFWPIKCAQSHITTQSDWILLFWQTSFHLSCHMSSDCWPVEHLSINCEFTAANKIKAQSQLAKCFWNGSPAAPGVTWSTRTASCPDRQPLPRSKCQGRRHRDARKPRQGTWINRCGCWSLLSVIRFNVPAEYGTADQCHLDRDSLRFSSGDTESPPATGGPPFSVRLAPSHPIWRRYSEAWTSREERDRSDGVKVTKGGKKDKTMGRERERVRTDSTNSSRCKFILLKRGLEKKKKVAKAEDEQSAPNVQK